MILRIKTDSKKEHAKIRVHKHAASLSALPLLGCPPAWLQGQQLGGPLPAFTACKLWAVGDQERCMFAAEEQGLGGRDSSSAGVEVFRHK